VSNNHEISKIIKKASKPMFIIGESALYGNSGQYVFESLKFFLKENNFIRKDWNGLNIISQQASRVGAIDLGVYSIKKDNNFSFFENIINNNFKFIYLLGADNFNFNKKDHFVVYQGSHGDKGAEIADVILPGAAYTEKNGLFVNLEGKMQNAYKASYPPGDAKEDWEIFKNISKAMKKNLGFDNLSDLRVKMNKYIETKNIDINNNIKVNFIENLINIKPLDYYYTNPIARSSKTMNECREIAKQNNLIKINKAS